jgi:hypothetical protein
LSRQKIKRAICALIATATLGGCSDIYFDRRETIALSAGDSLRTNQVTHMIDPWPAASANRNISYNGERMQSAVERYRQNRVTSPSQGNTSSAGFQLIAAPAATPAAKP